jgi:hypothetical protein
MSEQVSPVTDLPVASTSTLKKVARRTLIATALIGTVAAIYVKRSQNGSGPVVETPAA